MVPIFGGYITKEFLRFFFVGVTAFVITYSINSFLILLIDAKIGRSHDDRGIYVSSAFVVAYVSAFIFNFLSSKSWTFKDKGKKYTKQLIKFFIVHIVSLITFSILISILDGNGVTPLISLPFLAGIQMCTGFIFNKYWVFKKR